MGQRPFLFIAMFLLSQLCGQDRLSPTDADRLVIQKPEPVYPRLAKATKLQGTVKIDATVSTSGAVIATKLIAGHPLLVAAALEAVKKRTYRPYVQDGKPSAFVTTIDVVFSLGVPTEQDKRQQEIADGYFEQKRKCRELIDRKQWSEAEPVCEAAIPLADQLESGSELTKMAAYENVGYTLLFLTRYQEALSYFSRAFEFAKSRLTDADAEMGYAYRDLGWAKHGLGDLDGARKNYRQAENTLELARARIQADDLKQNYLKALKAVLRDHLSAAQQAGATQEAVDLQKRLNDLP